MKAALVSLAVLGVLVGPTSAATLWMQFEGGLDEVTLYPSDTVNVEIWVDLVAGDDLVEVTYPNWPDSPAEPLPYPSVEGVEQVSLTPGPGLGASWTGAASAGGTLGDGMQLVSVSGGFEDRLIGPGSFLVGVQTLHQNELLNQQSTYFNGQYQFDFYPIMFGGDPEWPGQLVDSTGQSYIFHTEYASYSGYYIWGQGSSEIPIKSPHAPKDDPLIVHCVPEPASLALLLLGGVAVVRRR